MQCVKASAKIKIFVLSVGGVGKSATDAAESMTGETLNARWPGENAGAMPPVGVTAKKPRTGAASSERSQAACLPCGTPEAGGPSVYL